MIINAEKKVNYIFDGRKAVFFVTGFHGYATNQHSRNEPGRYFKR